MGRAFTPELHLKGEYLKFFRKLRRRLGLFTGTTDFFSEIEGDIGEMLYTAQKDGKSLDMIIGEDEDEYIVELLRTFYEANPTKKVMAVKVGMSLTMGGSFALIGVILFNSIIVSIFTGIVGLVLYIMLVKRINDGLDSKAIKYMNIINNILYILILPLYMFWSFRGDKGESKIIVLGSICIWFIGCILTTLGNRNNKK